MTTHLSVNTPTHSYASMVYKYPQVAFPYRDLRDTNAARNSDQPEYELFDALESSWRENRYFDVTVEYAKAGPEDVICRTTITNRGPDPAPIHVAAVIHEAALLHDCAEMLLWCHAPMLALEIRERQRADASLRSTAVQREVVGIALADLKHALMKAWRLPDLLIRITDDRHTEHPSVRNVLLAIQLARHTARGWDNAALPDDVRDIAALLNLSNDATLQLLHELDT